jgi:UDP-GlcNAc:undecaprenyl-phosphate GlcNAc-1-phosphate transferase
MVFLGLKVLALSALISWVVTPWVIALGNRWGAVDSPGPRKIHTEPVPRIGGISIFVAFMVGTSYAAFASGFLPSNFSVKGAYWGSLTAAALVIFLMGLVDDVRGLSFRWKFLVQIAAGLVVWAFGFRIELLALPFGLPVLDLGPFSVVVTLLWIVAVTNAINLIDGLDGLAAGMALISTTTVAVIALYGGRVAVTAAAVALVGSLLGFLPYNFSPARIFLGDSGSMLLGFLLAVLSIHASQKGATAIAVLAPILVVGVPLIDTGLAILRRLYRLGRTARENENRFVYFVRNATVIFLPDRGHLHHRLLDLGLSQRLAVLTLYLGAVLTALSALALVVVRGRGLIGLLILVLFLLVTAFVALVAGFRMRARRRGKDAEQERRSWSLGPLRHPSLRDTTATPPE